MAILDMTADNAMGLMRDAGWIVARGVLAQVILAAPAGKFDHAYTLPIRNGNVNGAVVVAIVQEGREMFKRGRQ